MLDRNDARLRKVERLARGEQPRVVDLFSGCGGISLGFHRAGFDIVANVEYDRHAAANHARNFHPGDERYGQARDITAVEPEELMAELYPSANPAGLVDVIVGGPPCQAYTRIGRAKLRDVREHPEAFRLDPRGNLYLRYLHYVERLQPLALVMENVPDALNYGGTNIAQETAEALDAMGYECGYTLLNAVHYGVPQMRERMILVAIARELGVEPQMPAPTHWMDLPNGYDQMRQGATRELGQLSFFSRSHFMAAPRPGRDLPRFVSAREALCDLPFMTGPAEKEDRPDGVVSYPETGEITPYARLMRTWPGFSTYAEVKGHVTRRLVRDYPIFRRMQWGDQYPEAYKVAERIFAEQIAAAPGAVPGSDEYERLREQVVPPYDPSKFPNKWRKMEPDMPARTLMAHLGKDCYSHIHYDHDQARTISVREAARLQSFPDGFQFPPVLNAAYRMIGNAVPPLLALHVAQTLRETLHAAIAGRQVAAGSLR
ncbi:MAG TPA: DNA cytosine methyltransferase [Symbiobacteriaceae bacterium]|nr:DNA cytosine methyltransferase [Symbiobacteriaceae bacterium]